MSRATALCLVLAALAAARPCGAEREAPPFDAAPKWRLIFKGVELTGLEASKPRLMRGHAVRIDLKAAGVSFLATPDNGEAKGDTDGLKTSTFLTRHRCQLAINAAPFSPVVNEEGKPHTIAGLTVSRGKQVSQPTKGYPALLLTKDNRASLASPPFDLKGVYNAFGGFGIVLKKGEVQKAALVKGKPAIHPRTAAGISADGRYLYLLVIDGRQKDHSLGASTAEVGEWLKALGASEGINLDGGGTTALVVESGGKAKVINRPIHAGKPGTERVSASHLGVFAHRLKE